MSCSNNRYTYLCNELHYRQTELRLVRLAQADRNFELYGIERDNDGFDKDGFDADGFDRDGFDRDGFNRQGEFVVDVFPDRYDLMLRYQAMKRESLEEIEYNREHFGIARDNFGFDEFGFDEDGFDFDGVNRDGFDREGNFYFSRPPT